MKKQLIPSLNLRLGQLLIFVALAISSCTAPPKQNPKSETTTFMIHSEHLTDFQGQPVYRYVLDNGTMQVELSNFGGLVYKIIVPDRDGKKENVALTLDRVEDFLDTENPFFGATAGRVANMETITSMGERLGLTRRCGRLKPTPRTLP